MKSFMAFSGFFDAEDWCVWVLQDGKQVARLNPQLSILNKSPTGFAWGYTGSGPAQLAFALLANVIGAERAQDPRMFQSFKSDVIAKLNPKQGWELTEHQIKKWVEQHEREVAS